MRGHVLRRLDLAQQLLRVPPDAVVMDLDDLDLAGRIDHERAAICQAFLLDQYFEISRQGRGRIAHQRVLHLLDRVRRVVPSLVREMRVRGYAVYLDAELL